jgi:hypothetical protein
VLAVAFHTQNPGLFVSCGSDGRVHVLSTQQRTPFHSYAAHTGPAAHVSVSGDGRRIASCGDDKTIKIFDLTAQKLLTKFEMHTDRVTCISFHPTKPLLISGGADRTVRFFDIDEQRELHVSLQRDSAAIDVVHFADCAAFSASPGYLRVFHVNPPQLFESIPLGIDKVRDLALTDGVISVASTCQNRVLIHRMNLASLKGFSGTKPADLTAKPRQPTPRLLDLSAMANSAKPLSPRERPREAGDVFQAFRRPRSAYMAAMNDRFARLARLDAVLEAGGLGRVLKAAASSGELGPEILAIMRMRPGAMRLEHAALVLQIADRVFEADADLAVASVEAALQAFGKLAYATRNMAARGDGSVERKQHCERLVEAFRAIAPRLRTMAAQRSAGAQTAGELLEEWKAFLR